MRRDQYLCGHPEVELDYVENLLVYIQVGMPPKIRTVHNIPESHML
jgi:hypothetical protein